MTKNEVAFTVFTKPWTMPLADLAKLIKGLGLDGVELPVRPGYQVEPDNVKKGLKEAVEILSDEGIKIGSVAGSTDEATIAACGEAGIPIIRVCIGIDMEIGYKASEEKVRGEYDRLIPLLDKHGVAIGVQNHCNFCVGSAIGIMHLIENYDPKHVCAVLDMAHCAVDGEPDQMALDIVWSHVNGLVNFKSAFHRRLNGPEETEAEYAVHWTTSQHSGYSWSNLANLLKQRGYQGDICLPAEYTNMQDGGQLMGMDVIRPLKQDIAYIKALFASEAEKVETQGTNWEISADSKK